MVPAGGSSRPAIIRSTVVLPEPDGPSIEKNSPSRISRSMSSTATTGGVPQTSWGSRDSATAGSAAVASIGDLLWTCWGLDFGQNIWLHRFRRKRRVQTDLLGSAA